MERQLYLRVHCRHVILPSDIAALLPKGRMMSEAEWRKLGVQQSRGWIHYMLHRPGTILGLLVDERSSILSPQNRIFSCLEDSSKYRAACEGTSNAPHYNVHSCRDSCIKINYHDQLGYKQICDWLSFDKRDLKSVWG